MVPNSRERGQKSLKLTELPESPDDPPSEILRERPSKRKAPGNAPQERILFLGAPRPHPVIILWIIIIIIIMIIIIIIIIIIIPRPP